MLDVTVFEQRLNENIFDVNKFKQRLRDEREENNLKQDEFASLIGIARASASYYENKKNSALPNAEVLHKMAVVLNVSTDYLIGKTDIKDPDIDIRKISEKIGLSEKSIQNIFNARNNEPRNKLKRMPVLNSLLETWSFFSLLSEIAQFIIANEYAAKKLALLDADEFNNLEEIASLEKEAYKISGISEEIAWNVSPHEILLFKLHNQFEGIINEVTL